MGQEWKGEEEGIQEGITNTKDIIWKLNTVDAS